MKKALACSCAYCSHQCGLHQPIWAVQTAEEEQDLLKQCCCQPGAHRHVSCHCSVPLCVCVYTHGVYMWYMGVYTWSVSVGMCVYTCRVCVCVRYIYVCVCACSTFSHTREPDDCSRSLGVQSKAGLADIFIFQPQRCQPSTRNAFYNKR